MSPNPPAVATSASVLTQALVERCWERAPRFHPANPAVTHEIVGTISFVINLDEQPRWG